MGLRVFIKDSEKLNNRHRRDTEWEFQTAGAGAVCPEALIARVLGCTKGVTTLGTPDSVGLGWAVMAEVSLVAFGVWGSFLLFQGHPKQNG